MRTLRGTNATAAGAPSRPGASSVEIAELAVVVAALVQGAAVGAGLILFPEEALRSAGFPAAPGLFVRWAGLLHLLLATGYALEWLRARRVALLVIAKAATALFLLAAGLAGGLLPGLLLVAVAVDAATACAAAVLRGPAERVRRSRGGLKLVVSRPSDRQGERPALRPTTTR